MDGLSSWFNSASGTVPQEVPEEEVWPRGCSTPLAFLQTLVEWSDYAMGGSGSLCAGFSENSPPGARFRKLREICCPIYQETGVESLELQRQSFALALMGQLTVATFRLLTGHFSGSVIGMVLFVVGNNARCSLQSSHLTTFVIMSFTSGTMDSLDLVHNVFSEGPLSLLQLPFQAHLAHDLTAISLLMAPLVELGGARIAWDSYLKPSMLFRTSGPIQQTSATDTGSPSGFVDYIPSMASYFSPSKLSASYMQHDQPASSSWSFGGTGSPAQASSWQRGLLWGDGDGRAASSGEAPFGASPACAECGAVVKNGWTGSNSYAAKNYCDDCWSAWSHGYDSK